MNGWFTAGIRKPILNTQFFKLTFVYYFSNIFFNLFLISLFCIPMNAIGIALDTCVQILMCSIGLFLVSNLCADHVILTGRWMTNSVSNIDCLFWFFLSQHQNDLFLAKAPLNYLEDAPNFKTRPWLKNMEITIIQNLTLDSSFDALLKWHDPDLGGEKS